MAKKIESAKIIIKGEEIIFLKPRALDVIRIEDRSFSGKEGPDISYYNEAMLSLATRKYKVEDLVNYNPIECKLSNGETVLIPEVGYSIWIKSLSVTGEISRVEAAENAIRFISGDKKATADDLTYSDINELAAAFYGLYEQEELLRVVDEVATFCK
ncbi:MAG: hypothetical protein ACRC0F_10255 [Cetobacterium sp.]